MLSAIKKGLRKHRRKAAHIDTIERNPVTDKKTSSEQLKLCPNRVNGKICLL